MSLKYTNRVPPFSVEHLEAIAQVLADTDRGLTGSQIGQILIQIGVPDPDPSMTKWKRLYNAFVGFQKEHNVGNHVVVFITRAMDPAKYTRDRSSFAWRRDNLNPVLAFSGMSLGEDGRVRKDTKASNLDDALQKANRLQAELTRRKVHADVLTFCNAEVLTENYFHAVFEAMKSITSKIRTLADLTSDGAELVDQAFSLGKSKSPRVAINTLDSKTLEGEQRAFGNLLKGLYGVIRNPLAHNPKVEWEMTEQDAVDTLTIISLVHRKLDKARRLTP